MWVPAYLCIPEVHTLPRPIPCVKHTVTGSASIESAVQSIMAVLPHLIYAIEQY